MTRQAYAQNRPEHVDRATWQAYGPNYPGGLRRWLTYGEAEAVAQRDQRRATERRRRLAHRLWARVYGPPPLSWPPDVVHLTNYRDDPGPLGEHSQNNAAGSRAGHSESDEGSALVVTPGALTA